MKKLILGVALASFVISCKKIQAGGNKGVLKAEEGVGRYSDDEMKDDTFEARKNEVVSMDSTKASGMQTAPMIKDSAKVEAETAPTAH